MDRAIFIIPAVLIGGAFLLAVPAVLRAQPRIPPPGPGADPHGSSWGYRGAHRPGAPRRPRPAAVVPVPLQRIAVPLPPTAGWPQPIAQDARRVNDAITQALDLGVPAAYAIGDQVCAPDTAAGWFDADTATIPRVCDSGEITAVIPLSDATVVLKAVGA